MSPNSNPITTTHILEERNSPTLNKIFDDYECFVVHKGSECQYWMDKCAIGRAEVFPTLKQTNGKYWWDVKGYRVINVVHRQSNYQSRYYAYFENLVDMFAFVNYFNEKSCTMKSGSFECHEVFLGQDPSIKMFFDIESVIPLEVYDSMKQWMNGDDLDMAKMVSDDVINAMNLALEEVDSFYDMYESLIDYAIVSRCRKIDDRMKLSYHLITNVSMRVSECKALVKLIKDSYLSCVGGKRPDGYLDMLCAKKTLDTNPYSKNGTLSLPGSSKDGHTLIVVQPFKRSSMSLHLIDTDGCNGTHDFTDDLPIKANVSDREAFEETSSEFVKKALAKLDSKRVPAYDSSAMDLYANTPRNNYLRVARTAPSHCPECDRTHDNADTLLLIFNETQGFALWKCAHNEEMKAKRWFGNSGQKEYEIATHDDDEIEAFARSAKPVPDKKVPDKKHFPKFVRHFDGIPPIFDKTFESSYFDGITISTKPISMETLYDFIKNNIAFILNGGNSFYLTKSRDEFGNIDYNTVDNSLKFDISFAMNGKALTAEERANDEIEEWELLRDVILNYRNDITFDRIDFVPFNAKTGQYDPKDPSKQFDWNSNTVFNKFTGFMHGYDPDFIVDESKFKTFSKHLHEGWCSGDDALSDFTVKMNAWYVQRPFEKSQVCMVVQSKEGAGKNQTSDKIINHVIGRQYCLETPSMKLLTGRFNHAREAKLFTVLNEAAQTTKTSAPDQEVLKDVITEDSVMIERKGIDPYRVSDRNNVVIFSNNSYSIKASTEMRRFVFYEMSNRFIGNTDHFDQLNAEFNTGNAGIHLYHYLMNIDITDFKPQRDAPITKLKTEMRKLAIEKPIRWFIDSINGDYESNVLSQTSDEQASFTQLDDLHDDFNGWLAINATGTAYNRDRFSKALVNAFGVSQRKRLGGNRRVRGYGFSIIELKRMISAYTGRKDLFDE